MCGSRCGCGCGYRCGCVIVQFMYAFLSSYVPDVMCPNQYSQLNICRKIKATFKLGSDN